LYRYFAIAALLTCSFAQAQFPTPQLNSVYPCGGQRGTTVEATITGGDIDAATGLYFSHPGITAEPAGPKKFKITIADNVPVGRYDIRAICPLGVSSCRSFAVGDRKEFQEAEPNNLQDKANRVELPATINGQVNNGVDLDHFVFTAKKGQRVIVNAWAWRLDSKLDATLMVYDPAGKEIAFNGDYYGKDALVDFTAEQDGDYTVKIWDFIYSSSPELVYRLEIGSLPHLDAIVPAVVTPGKPTMVTIYGRNLPNAQKAPPEVNVGERPLEMLTQELTLDPKTATLGTGEVVRPATALLEGTEFRLQTPAGASNPFFVGFAESSVVPEQEPNNSAETAQLVTIPCEVTGTFSPVSDLDYFKFAAKKNQKLVVEIFGERQSGLTDPMLSSFDEKGKRLTSGDDFGRNIGKLRFATNTRDGRWDYTATAEGMLTVQVRDLYHQQRGDARFTYRLSFREPQPSFRLIAVPTAEILPDSTVVRQGGKYWLDVLVNKEDGFDEQITVTAEDLPAGVTAEPVIIGPGKTSVPLVFQAAVDAPFDQKAIRIVGRAKVGDVEMVNVARGGGLIWSTVNTPGISRMQDSIMLSVREPAPFNLQAEPKSKEVIAGEKLELHVKLTRAADWNDEVQLAGFDLPQNATMALVNIEKGKTEAKVELAIAANVKPGKYTFTVNGSGQMARNYSLERDSKKWDKNLRGVLPSNPLTIEILPPVKK
jgi:hypothetical protein